MKVGENSALRGGFSVVFDGPVEVEYVQKYSQNAVKHVPNSYGHGTSKCNEMSYLTLHLNVTQWFLAIFMEHRLNTQHSQLHSLLYF